MPDLVIACELDRMWHGAGARDVRCESREGRWVC